MRHVPAGQDCLDYQQCRYAGSRLDFRGPARDLSRPHVLCLGGTRTFGRFIARPWPDRLEAALGIDCVNLGVVNGGLDSFVQDPAVPGLLSRARAVVIQVMGAQNLSNRFYSVHPRRNDRFLCASPRLVALFPEVDFTEFHFTRHLLMRLCQISPTRCAEVLDELRAAWAARMATLVAMARGPVVLLWLSDAPPPTTPAGPDLRDPPLIDAAMLDALSPRLAGIARATGPLGAIRPAALPALVDSAAAALPAPEAHGAAAAELLPLLRRALQAT